MSVADFGHLTPGEIEKFSNILRAARERPVPFTFRRRFPESICHMLLAIARSDGIVLPAWEVGEVRLERRPATCWDYLAAGIWSIPALVQP